MSSGGPTATKQEDRHRVLVRGHRSDAVIIAPAVVSVRNPDRGWSS